MAHIPSATQHRLQRVMAFDESKVNRSGDGQFSNKLGSNPEISLSVPSGVEEATRDTILDLFPGATSVEFSSFDLNSRDGYGPDPDEPYFNYSVRKVMAGDTFLYDEEDEEDARRDYYDNWTKDSGDFRYENPAEDVAANLQDAFHKLWGNKGAPESFLVSQGHGRVEL